MSILTNGSMYWSFPVTYAAISCTLDLVNGDIEDEREIIDVEYEEISSTHDDTSNNQS
ncbi:hypothetical protein [uncultured Duncaniella sp.]|uniref:hypothetical protein n=1 Tax=uncultured Duncaniella sp. TaxID=2768039 RepID=UPI0025A934A8|nr:hypothetical protein [uncultured Duncaniella sp.]